MRPEEFIQHYGVKGMKWGVRRYQPYPKGENHKGKFLGRDQKGNSSSKEHREYSKALQDINSRKLSRKERVRNLRESKEKSLAKLEPSEKDPPRKKGLTDGQKRAMMIGIGAVVVAGASYVAYKNRSNIKEFIQKNIDARKGVTPGDRVSSSMFNKQVNESMSRVWETKRYVDQKSLNRKAFTIPKGRQFNRLSTASEKSFGETTFATSTMDDFNRYVSGFRSELTGSRLHHVSFSATKDIKVPDTTTVLRNLEKVMATKYSYAKKTYVSQSVDKKKVLEQYNKLAGTSFSDDIGHRLVGMLKKQGYSAIVDEMDQGVIGDLPLLIIDPKAFTSKSSKLLSKSDIAKAGAALKELTNRR